MLDEETTFQLNPKFKVTKSKDGFVNSDATEIMSNHYAITLKKDFKTIFQYSIDFEPQLPPDATKVCEKIIDSVRRELKGKIGLICFKGRMLWGNLKSDLALIIKTTVQVKDEKQEYEVIVKPSISLTIQQFITKDEDNLIKLSQILNVNTKNVLKEIGYKELDKGKYYKDEDFGVDKINNAGLSVWRGYQVNVCPVNGKLFMRVDVCSRVLRQQSFLDTMKETNSIKDKKYINELFIGSSVITRYGNHRIFRIQEIDYSMTPKSTFENVRAQKKQSFIEYYKTAYQCTIKDENQPLIQVKVKNCQKEEIQFLVPELVCLTGLTDDQRADFNVMKAVAEKTKLKVDERVAETHGIVAELNKKGVKQLSFEISQKAEKFPAHLLGAPMIEMGNRKQIQPNKGEINLRNLLLDPINLKNYYFVYTTRGDRDEDDADATISFLMQASKSYGIKLGDPIMVNIKVPKDRRLTVKDWINEIELQNKQGLPEFVILYFNNEEKKDKQLYEKLKSHLIHKCQLNSQVITKRTLCAGAKGAMSKASKILLQINDKMGHPLYKVEKQHPFWSKNAISIGSLAVSRGAKDCIASFVGTRSNDLTQHYSDYDTIQQKEFIPEAVLSKFVSGWLKQYFKTEGKKLPGVILLYREGLNEKQAGKVLAEELNILHKAFEEISGKAKIAGWKPKLIYLLVSQKNGTRAYEIDRGGRLSNPLPGTIIGSQLSKDGSYEFLMASALTTEGTCNMVQYKVAYDSSNQEVPHEALKIITYEQCYNYPNWSGSIRFPATLQKANKLAKFVANHGEKNIDKANPLKGLDYYI